MIEKEKLKLYANKLMFDMKDEEYQTLQEEFDIILKQMDLIGKIDGIEKVSPMTFPFPNTDTALREDEEGDYLTVSEVLENAILKVATWDLSISFFIKSILCGVVIYIAVLMYRKGTPLGIIFGIPLFIFCGFQHCIANVITMGVARIFDLSLLICIVGNFMGSLIMWYFSKDLEVLEDKEVKKLREEANK